MRPEEAHVGPDLVRRPKLKDEEEDTKDDEVDAHHGLGYPSMERRERERERERVCVCGGGVSRRERRV